MNLTEIVQQVVDDYETTDVDELSRAALARIDAADYRDALRTILPTYVRSFISRNRGPADAPLPPRPSAKVAAVRDAWERWLDELVSVGPNRYARRGDMTAADCRYAAQLRRRHAEANAVEADKWEDWAERIERTGAACLREVPAEMRPAA